MDTRRDIPQKRAGGPHKGGKSNRPRGRGGPGPGGRKGGYPPARGGKRKLPPAVLKQAKDLVEQSGIPFSAAVRVAQGKTTLNTVLQELLREEKIKTLIEQHDINRALATNVALGRTDLDIVLLRRRKNETLHKFYHRSCLEESMEGGRQIAIGVHGNKKIVGQVVELDKYTFKFEIRDEPEPIEVHKTTVKFAYDPDHYKQVRKFVKTDKKIKGLEMDPILRAKDRFHFKNLSLQRSLDERLEVMVTTLEGDQFKGHVEWFGRWEFGLKFKGGVRLTVFRHGVYRLSLVK